MLFLDLPDDIYFHLISYLQIQDRISLAQSHERLRLIVINNTRIYDFEKQYATSNEKAVEYIGFNPKHALKVSIKSCFWFDQNEMTRALRLCSNLKELNMLNFHISNVNLCHILKNLSHLRSLSIQYRNPIPLSYITAPVRKSFRNLRNYTFSVNSSSIFREEWCLGKYELNFMLGHCHCLQSLNAKFCEVPRSLYQLHPPPNCEDLQEITLECPEDNTHQFFCHLNMPNLSQFEMSFPKKLTFSFHHRPLPSIEHGSQLNDCITELEVYMNRFYFPSISHSYKHLKHLRVCDCVISENYEGTHISFPQLVTLFISPWIPLDVTHLCRSLHCSKLESLSLDKCYVLFDDDKGCQEFLNHFIKGLKHLELPTICISSIPTPILNDYGKRRRISHLRERDEACKDYILQHLCTQNPLINSLTLHYKALLKAVMFSDGNLSVLKNLQHLTNFSFEANEIMTGTFLCAMADQCFRLEHLSINKVTPPIIRYLFTQALDRFKCLTYLSISAKFLMLPVEMTLRKASRLVRAVFSFDTSNCFNLNLTPKQIVEQHPSLTFLFFISEDIKTQDTKVPPKTAARFICITPFDIRLYQDLLNAH